MKIILLNDQVPFLKGGAEALADSLKIKLEQAGHQVEIVGIPFKWYPIENVLRAILTSRLLDLSTSGADLAIAFKFPAYLVPFENKKLWLVHQFRQAYDLWGTPYQDFPNTPEGVGMRDAIRQADNLYLRQAKAIYTNSQIVADRLKTFNGITAQGVLFPPLLQPELFHLGANGDYFFYPARIGGAKRQMLAVEAMRHVKSGFKLVLAGKADSDAYHQQMQATIREYGLEDRVVMTGWISEEEKARLMANCFASLYLAYNEDSYGFSTLEAFHSHKAVLTLTDSGGTHEIITDGFNGLILEPSAEALAEGMERLWEDRQKGAEMGENAFQSLSLHHIEWGHVLERLTE